MKQRLNNTLTQTLIVINLMMAMVVFFRGGFDNPATLIAAGADAPALVRAGEYWRWLAATFVHGSVLHLAFNMFALWQLGTLVEYLFGWPKMLIIYVLSGLGGSILSDYFSAPYATSVGASGAVFGLAGAALGMGARHRDQLNPMFRQWLTSGLVPLIIFNFAFGLSMPNINNWAHGGGLLTGFICGYLIYPDIAYHKQRTSSSTLFVLGIVFAMLAYTAVFTLRSALDPATGFATQPMQHYSNPRYAFIYPKTWQIYPPVLGRNLMVASPTDPPLELQQENEMGKSETIVYPPTNFQIMIKPLLLPVDAKTLTPQNAEKITRLLLLELADGKESVKTSLETIPGGARIRYEYDYGIKGAVLRVKGVLIIKNDILYRFEFRTLKENDYFYSKLADRMLGSVKVQ